MAFTPGESTPAPVGIVVDVLRATSTICQALASGYRRVLCCAEVDEARALAESEGSAKLAGERRLEPLEGFDLGNSPREYLEPLGETLVLTTTNGTRAIVTAAARCDRVFVGSLLNVSAVVDATREAGDDVVVVCAGVLGALALDDAFVAGRIAAALDCERTDAAEAAARAATTWSGAEEALRASKSGRNLVHHAPQLAEDIPFCARESVLDVAPRFVGMHGVAAEITS